MDANGPGGKGVLAGDRRAERDVDVARLPGPAANESVVGFVHVGSIVEPAGGHARAPLADLLGEWSGPAP